MWRSRVEAKTKANNSDNRTFVVRLYWGWIWFSCPSDRRRGEERSVRDRMGPTEPKWFWSTKTNIVPLSIQERTVSTLTSTFFFFPLMFGSSFRKTRWPCPSVCRECSWEVMLIRVLEIKWPGHVWLLGLKFALRLALLAGLFPSLESVTWKQDWIRSYWFDWREVNYWDLQRFLYDLSASGSIRTRIG